MSRVLLDSTCVIDILRGRPDAVQRLTRIEASGDELLTCAIVAGEVSAGIRPHEREAVHDLFDGLSAAPLGIPEGRLAGWWQMEFRKRGRTLGLADCLIAAAAVAMGARLATGNPKDFPMKGLEIEHWPAGE